MRFDSAREAGLTETRAALVTDDYADSLSAEEVAALELTDALLEARSVDAALRQALRAHFSDAQIVELALGVGLFMGMSKVLILLGLEPESMQTTVLPTPGS